MERLTANRIASLCECAECIWSRGERAEITLERGVTISLTGAGASIVARYQDSEWKAQRREERRLRKAYKTLTAADPEYAARVNAILRRAVKTQA